MPNRCRSNCFPFLTDGYAFFRLVCVVVSVFQAHDNFCIKVKTKCRLIFNLNHPPEIHALTGTTLVGNHND